MTCTLYCCILSDIFGSRPRRHCICAMHVGEVDTTTDGRLSQRMSCDPLVDSTAGYRVDLQT